MSEDTQRRHGAERAGLVQAALVARDAPLQRSQNGISYAAYGQNELRTGELERIIQAVPEPMAAALQANAYYFVPLAMSSSAAEVEREHRGESEETMIAPTYTPELGDGAICHRNVTLGQTEGVFISTRLLNDRFSLAFEFFINVGHAFAESSGIPDAFQKLTWSQAVKDVRGETSQDAWESRKQSVAQSLAVRGTEDVSTLQIDEKARSEYFEANFSDAIAIYLLSLAMDFHYSELREREYPLLAPHALAERLRLMASLFPPNPGYEFAIRYRRRA